MYVTEERLKLHVNKKKRNIIKVLPDEYTFVISNVLDAKHASLN